MKVVNKSTREILHSELDAFLNEFNGDVSVELYAGDNRRADLVEWVMWELAISKQHLRYERDDGDVYELRISPICFEDGQQ